MPSKVEVSNPKKEWSFWKTVALYAFTVFVIFLLYLLYLSITGKPVPFM
jgi:hypothetical protein